MEDLATTGEVGDELCYRLGGRIAALLRSQPIPVAIEWLRALVQRRQELLVALVTRYPAGREVFVRLALSLLHLRVQNQAYSESIRPSVISPSRIAAPSTA